MSGGYDIYTYIVGKEVELAKSRSLSECSDGTLVWTLTDCFASWEELS